MSRTSYILNMAACMALLFASIACQKDGPPCRTAAGDRPRCT